MARIRTIKPDFFTSEDIVKLSPMARLLYIALWCESDREGRFVWRPATFKLRYFPADRVNIEALGKELLDRHLVILYGEGNAYIPSFLNHQHINPRETHSCLPVPDASARVTDAQGGRKEGRKEDIERVEDAPNGFEDLWATYPHRAGGNPKAKAAKAYRARLGEGHAPGEILEGTRRYASFVRATGKEGTEYVKQAATFLGPDKHFLEEWALPEQANVSPLYRREGAM